MASWPSEDVTQVFSGRTEGKGLLVFCACKSSRQPAEWRLMALSSMYSVPLISVPHSHCDFSQRMPPEEVLRFAKASLPFPRSQLLLIWTVPLWHVTLSERTAWKRRSQISVCDAPWCDHTDPQSIWTRELCPALFFLYHLSHWGTHTISVSPTFLPNPPSTPPTHWARC